MIKTKQKKAIISVLLLVVVLIAGLYYYFNHDTYKGTPLEPIKSLISIQHFDKGTYKDYAKLFENKKNIVSRVDFDKFRNAHIPKDTFQFGYSSIKDIMKHMKVVKNGVIAKVYYLKNIKDQNEMKSSSFWNTEKKNGRWMIKN